ncbi:hypothetical protein DFJ74DRAFT_764132 [Hyaloraphidium curvatum]|nr:hypothetical protein DFJ74DRAFT_764132 [Hyaloraphidium curvatum]
MAQPAPAAPLAASAAPDAAPSSAAPPPTRDPSLSLICESCSFTGDVKLGKNNVFHHHVRLDASGGPIVVGDSNIFEDRVHVVNRGPGTLVIGSENLLEIGCSVEGSMGNGCTIEPRAKVAAGAKLGNRVVVTPMACAEGELVDGTVVFIAGGEQKQHLQSATALSIPSTPLHLRHIELLRDVLPRYNKTRVQ